MPALSGGSMIRALCLYAMVVIPILGCTIDDEDRCPPGLVYAPEYKACQCPAGQSYSRELNRCACPDDRVWAPEKEACLETDAGAMDAGAQPEADAGSDMDEGKESGLGEKCGVDGDCAEYLADACAVNPLTNDGYCTWRCAGEDDCEAGYQCCDCTSNTMGLPEEKACLADEDATLASSTYVNCVCE